jgi:hypothetical protein
MRLAAQGSEVAGLDIEAVRSFNYRPALRDALRGYVRRVTATGEGRVVDQPDDPPWDVASTYVAARAVGENPTAAVAGDLALSRAAAAQRVRRARAKGYLNPTTKGKVS